MALHARQEYAARAMQALLTGYLDDSSSGYNSIERIVELSFEIADLMVLEDLKTDN